MLKESLEAKNLLDALGSFSEDEGDDDDDEGDDDDGGDGSGEEPAEETEGDVSTDEKLAVKGEAISPQKTENNDQEKPPQPVSDRFINVTGLVLFYVLAILLFVVVITRSPFFALGH